MGKSEGDGGDSKNYRASGFVLRRRPAIRKLGLDVNLIEAYQAVNTTKGSFTLRMSDVPHELETGKNPST